MTVLGKDGECRRGRKDWGRELGTQPAGWSCVLLLGVIGASRGQQRAGSVLPSARCKCSAANAPGHQRAQNLLQHHVTPCVSPVLTRLTEAPA